MTKAMRVLFTGVAMTIAASLFAPAASAQVSVPQVPSTPGVTAVTADTVADEAAFVAHINALRATKGLRPLRVDARLTRLGRAWAAKMAADGDISHNLALPKVAPSTWVRLGENVGTGRQVDRIHRAFVASPTHYRNLVGSYDSVGVGVVRVGERIYVAEQFMASRRVFRHLAWARIPVA